MTSPVPKDWEAGAGWGPWAVLLRRSDGEHTQDHSTPAGRLFAAWATVLAVVVPVGVAWFVRQDLTPASEPDLMNLGLAVVTAGLACGWSTVAGLTLRVPWMMPLVGAVAGCMLAHAFFYFDVVPLIGEYKGDPDLVRVVMGGGFLGGTISCVVGAAAAIMVVVPVLWLLGLRESNKRVEREGLVRDGRTEVREDQRLEETDGGGWTGRG